MQIVGAYWKYIQEEMIEQLLQVAQRMPGPSNRSLSFSSRGDWQTKAVVLPRVLQRPWRSILVKSRPGSFSALGRFQLLCR